MTQYALEWSQSTNNFHIQPVASLCTKNQAAFIDDSRVNDYHVLMIGTLEAVSRMAASWRERIAERDRIRNQARIRTFM